MGFQSLFAHLCDFQHDGTFDTFLVEFATCLVHASDAAGGVVCVGCTSAAAVELGEAVGTFLVGVYVAALELVADRVVGDAVVNVSQQELFVSHELMTWIEVAGWSHCHVFRAHATS